MLADLGFFLLFMCTILSGYSTVASIASGRLRHRRLYRSARVASSISAIFCFLACLILWFLLFQKDYSVAYIFKNSSNDLPPIYRITAFWSSLEGSHTLWTLLLSFYSVIALWTAAKDNEHIMPWVNAALQAVLTWMFWLVALLAGAIDEATRGGEPPTRRPRVAAWVSPEHVVLAVDGAW